MDVYNIQTAMICVVGCTQPYCHLLEQIFPEGHRDRNKTIQQIIDRDKQQCLFGGEDETNHGIPLGGSAATVGGLKEEREPIEEEGLDALLAAAADAAEGTR